MADRTYLEALSRRLADEGKLIEAGWVGFRLMVIQDGASAAQLDGSRIAFMAGAHHLFASILAMLDPGAEETDDELRRMDLIHRELDAFRQELELRAARPKGPPS